MSAPALDLSLLAEHLRSALVPDAVVSVTVLGDQSQDSRNRRARTTPTLAVVPERRDVSLEADGYAECARTKEDVLLVIQLRHAGPGSDDEGYPALRQICDLIYDAFTGAIIRRPDAHWHQPNTRSWYEHFTSAFSGIGWQPPDYRGGRLLSIDQDRFSWAERYRFTRL